MIVTVGLFIVASFMGLMAAIVDMARERSTTMTAGQAKFMKVFFALCAVVVFMAAWSRL